MKKDVKLKVVAKKILMPIIFNDECEPWLRGVLYS